MKKFIENIKFIFMPHYWIMNYDYCEKWDSELRNLMQENDFKQCSKTFFNIKYIDEYQVKIGDKIIWIVNHPYASFCDNSFTDKIKIQKRPSRQTIYLAKKKLEEDKKKIDWDDNVQLRRERALNILGI
jgi:hypothetical protein